jgi:hypothetical protein
MSTNAVRGKDAASKVSVAAVDMKFEIVVVPVADVDRAKEFYAKLGWRLDADYDSGKDFRVIQFTAPRGCPVASTPQPRPSRPPTIWRAGFAVRRPLTVSMRSASARRIRTGPTGMPSTRWLSRPERSSRRELVRDCRDEGWC